MSAAPSRSCSVPSVILLPICIATMENFQEMMTQAAELKEMELKKERTKYEALPDFLKSGLNHSKRYAHLRSQHFYTRMFVSDQLKNQGNLLIADQKYGEALAKYEESLAIFRYIVSDTNQNLKDQDLHYHYDQPEAQHLELFHSHLIKIYLNISLCLTKLNRKAQGVVSAEEALKLDDDNAKAFYRKGQAYLQYVNRDETDIKAGFAALEQAYKISKDPAIYQEMVALKKEILKQREKEKKAFCFIINQNKASEEGQPKTLQQSQSESKTDKIRQEQNPDKDKDSKTIQTSTINQNSQLWNGDIATSQKKSQQQNSGSVGQGEFSPSTKKEQTSLHPVLKRSSYRKIPSVSNATRARIKKKVSFSISEGTEGSHTPQNNCEQQMETSIENDKQNKVRETCSAKIEIPLSYSKFSNRQISSLRVQNATIVQEKHCEESKAEIKSQVKIQSRSQLQSELRLEKINEQKITSKSQLQAQQKSDSKLSSKSRLQAQQVSQLKSTESLSKSKQQQTQQKLIKMLDGDDWELQLMEQFINKNGRKITAIMNLYGYKEYQKQHDELLMRCISVINNFKEKIVEFQDKGQVVKIDLSMPEAKAAVREQKLKIYQEYMNWLEKHPMPQSKKYFIRYDTHKKFILKQIEIREGPIEIIRAKPKKQTNVTSFYLVAAFVIFWAVFNIYMRMK